MRVTRSLDDKHCRLNSTAANGNGGVTEITQKRATQYLDQVCTSSKFCISRNSFEIAPIKTSSDSTLARSPKKKKEYTS